MQPPHLQEHIDLIARHEQEFFKSRTRSERAGDAIAAFAGSLRFVILHLLLFTGWMLLNTLQHFSAWRFDPYPFPMLDTIVAVEAILLASFILMRQTRMGRRSEECEHLTLQLLLLTEKEVTALVQVTRQMAQHIGLKQVGRDSELEAMSQETSIDGVAESIKESLPPEA